MTGDWIKIRCALPDEPEVVAISNQLQIDQDAVVGKLVRVWSWFDQHTIDGDAASVTPALLDRISFQPGFGRALQDVGWLEVENDAIRMPGFSVHNGKSAKRRALTARRMAQHRGGKSDAPSVTSASPREERDDVSKNNKNTISNSDAANVTSASHPIDWKQVRRTWNQVAREHLGRATIDEKRPMSATRRRKYLARLKQFGPTFLERVCAEIPLLDDFAREGSWLTFDWVIQSEGNATKLLEGNYRRKEGDGGGQQPLYFQEL